MGGGEGVGTVCIGMYNEKRWFVFFKKNKRKRHGCTPGEKLGESSRKAQSGAKKGSLP